MRRAVLAACLLIPLTHGASEAPATAPAPPRDADPKCVPANLSLGPESRTYQGTVSVKFRVAANASISAVEVTAGSPPPAVAQAVEHAIRACRWIPGTGADGQPVAADMVVTVEVKVEKAKAQGEAPAPGGAPAPQ